jgi:hypothetical protein
MVTGVAGGDHHDSSCELCEAARLTEWFHEDESCWIAECEACCVPMVVWRRHDPSPPDPVRAALLARLDSVVRRHYGFDHWIDENMRSIPTHYHAHARPRPALGGPRRPRDDRPDSRS